MNSNIRNNKINNSFTIGITDDISNTSYDFSNYSNKINSQQIEIKIRWMWWDWMVWISKSIIKIIWKQTNNYIQWFFYYDSKKANWTTISHLRISKNQIKSRYLIYNPNIVVISHNIFTKKYDILEWIEQNWIVIFNSVLSDSFFWNQLPKDIQQIIKEKNLKIYTIDAYWIAKKYWLNTKISTVMMSIIFKILKKHYNQILNLEKFDTKQILQEQIKKIFSDKWNEIINKNLDVINYVLQQKLEEINYSNYEINGQINNYYQNLLKKNAGSDKNFVEDIVIPCLKLKWDTIPVSKMSIDWSIPSWFEEFDEKIWYNKIPVRDKTTCIKCTFCSFHCPHNAIQSKIFTEQQYNNFDEKMKDYLVKQTIGDKNYYFGIFINPNQCTWCWLCVDSCPMKNSALSLKDKNSTDLNHMQKIFDYFKNYESKEIPYSNCSIQASQLKKSYFSYSWACAWCWETPIIKLMTQLFGPKLIIANATWCSSIYWWTFPITPWTKNSSWQWPSWANSLFEDNAEFGYWLKLANDILNKDNIVRIIWWDWRAYDIWFSWLDHIISSWENLNILVLNTQWYSNTWWQCSKASPIDSKPIFAKQWKKTKSKDLAKIFMSYWNVYVANINLQANNIQAIQAFQEAVDRNWPSIIIAYSNCISHWIDMSQWNKIAKLASNSWFWPLFRYNPKLKKEGKNPLIIDRPQEINQELLKEFKSLQKRF